MGNGHFSDTGYRMRRNKFSRADRWTPFRQYENHDFYEVLPFNTDTFDVGLSYTRIAEMYIRLNPDETTHIRVVYSFYDWLGSIAGINFVLV